MIDKIKKIIKRYNQVTSLLGNNEIASNPSKYNELAKEHHELEPIAKEGLKFIESINQKNEYEQILKENDEDLKSIALEEIDTIKKDILVPELNLGDAVLFNFKIVHGSSGNKTLKSRRAFSMRFIGDDVRFIDRGGPTSPPFDGINLKSGDLMREDWFPRVFNN